MPFPACSARSSALPYWAGVPAGFRLSLDKRCEDAMQPIPRGEPLPINQALNRPRAKLGLDLTAWMAIVFVCVTVFLVGFRLLAMLAFPTLAVGAWLIVRKHPKMFQLWGLSLSQKSYYDPRKY